MVMAGLRTVVLDALPTPGGGAVAVPLAALAATLLASLAAGLRAADRRARSREAA